MKVLVTGGAGFIGSALVRHLIDETEYDVVNLDALTYAGNLESLGTARESPRYAFEHADVCDGPTVARILAVHEPDAIIHLAAESHVDRSIDSPGQFVRTNVVGTSELLSAATAYWERLPRARADRFRMLHVSTDEVFGSLDGDGGYFTEETPYRPSSPYSASKAGADHLVRAWVRTYGLPALITNCSNNYGPCQFPEKLIPLMILNGLEGKPLPVYGRGENVRDWLYVDDHVRALVLVLERGRVGECYAVGGGAELKNIDVVRTVARLLDELAPDSERGSHQSLIRFVEDRPGHDLRYAIDASKIRGELGWRPRESFETGLAKTVAWYIENREWWERVRSGEYRGERLGLGSRV